MKIKYNIVHLWSIYTCNRYSLLNIGYMGFDFRLHLESMVRIAQEHVVSLCLRRMFVFLLCLKLCCSVSISFDAIVYNSMTYPLEAVVASYFNGRGDRQPSPFLKKLKKLHSSKKYLSLCEKTFAKHLMIKKMEEIQKM